MIVVLDTNVFYGDVRATGGGLTTLFAYPEKRDDVEILIPAGVVEELVRQFGERLRILRREVKKLSFDLRSLGFDVPALPEQVDAAIPSYRQALTERLSGPRRHIADHPPTSGRIVEWVAQRRHPIRARGAVPEAPSDEPEPIGSQKRRKTDPVDGVVDAAIWLTVMDAAKSHQEVVLITNNTHDFADPADKAKLHPLLVEDLAADGAIPDRISLQRRVVDFNDKYIAPSAQAQAEAEALLTDPGSHSAVVSEIEDAVEWFPLELGSQWHLDVEVDDSTMSEFTVSEVELIRADPAPGGFYMTLIARGVARFDLGIRKSDAYGISEESPVKVYDWDWNESMVAAEAELPAELLIEILVENGKLGVSLDAVEPDNSAERGPEQPKRE